MSSVISQVCCCRRPLYSAIKANRSWSKRRTISDESGRGQSGTVLSSYPPLNFRCSNILRHQWTWKPREKKSYSPNRRSMWRRPDKTAGEGSVAWRLTCSTQTSPVQSGSARYPSKNVQETLPYKYSKHALAFMQVMPVLSCLSSKL